MACVAAGFTHLQATAPSLSRDSISLPEEEQVIYQQRMQYSPAGIPVRTATCSSGMWGS